MEVFEAFGSRFGRLILINPENERKENYHSVELGAGSKYIYFLLIGVRAKSRHPPF